MKQPVIILLLAVTFCFAACKNPNQKQQQESNPETNEQPGENEIIDISFAEKGLEENEPHLEQKDQSTIAVKNIPESNQEIKTDFTRQPKEVKILPGNEVAPFARLYSSLAQPRETFILHSQKDTTITCKQGTIISVNAGSFVYEQSGKPAEGDILFSVQEYYNLSDMLLAGLSTTSNGEILETGGMIYLEASSGGEPLVLHDGAEIRLEFPYEEKKDGMQLFSGTWTDHGINWEVMNETDVPERDTLVFEEVDDLAQFPGGTEAFWRYISSGLRYPAEARNSGIQGTVFAGFIITETGDIKDITIQRGLHSSIDQEVIRVLEAMPQWIPARREGINVTSRSAIPIRFILNGGGGMFETSEDDLHEPLTEDNLEDATFGDIQRYIFYTSQTGWINVDVFIRNRTPLRKMAVKIEEQVDIRMILVLKEFNTLINGISEKNNYVFPKVPHGFSAKLVAIKHENGKFHLAIDPSVTLSDSYSPKLNYKPVTMEGLQQALELIDN